MVLVVPFRHLAFDNILLLDLRFGPAAYYLMESLLSVGSRQQPGQAVPQPRREPLCEKTPLADREEVFSHSTVPTGLLHSTPTVLTVRSIR